MEKNLLPKQLMNQHLTQFVPGEIDLQKLFLILRNEKWKIFIFMVSVFLFGCLYVLLMEPTYKANALITVENKNKSLGNIQTQLMEGKGATSCDTQIALIKSRYILEPVIKALKLDINVKPHYFPIFGSRYAHKHSLALSSPPLFKWFSRFAWGGESLNLKFFEVPRDFNNLAFKLVSSGNNGYTLFDPNNTTILKGRVGQLAISENKDVKLLVNGIIANPGTEFFITKKFHQNLLERINKRIEIIDLGNNSQSNQGTGVLSVSLTDSSPIRAVDILNTIVNVLVKSDMEHKSAEAAKTLTFLQHELPNVKKSLNNAEMALNQYRSKTGKIDISIESKSLLNQIAEIEKSLSEVRLTRAEKLLGYTTNHPEIAALTSKEVQLNTDLKMLQKKVSALPNSDQVATNLMRDVDVRSQLYLLMLNQIQELQVIKAGTISDVRILNYAELPESAEPLHRSIILTCGAFFGAMLGCLYVLLMKSVYQHVHDPDWMEHHFGLQNLAILPYSKTQNEINNASGGRILAISRPKELTIEALRSLRTSLQFLLQNANNNIISIMGIAPNVGKTFISLNLSCVLADTNKKILLVDADMRKGRLHEYLQMNRGPGLSELLSNTSNWEEVCKKTIVPNVDVILSGTYPSNPSELLLSQNFKALLDQASAEYDLVLIDTPPILAVTDSSVISRLTSLNLLVVGSGMHPSRDIEFAIRRINHAGGALHGCIFNHNTEKSKPTTRLTYYYDYSSSSVSC